MRKKQKNLEIVRYKPNAKDGLTFEQVAERKQLSLINTVSDSYSKSYLSIFITNIFTFFNLLGAIVTLALIYAGAEISQFFFVIIYVCNIAIGIVQEIRAKLTIDKLTLVSNRSVSVIREGQTFDISSKEIVLDDIISLEIGNQIPTDCLILEGEVEVNESLLTGESVSVKKRVGDHILAGSYITGGNCVARANKVGKDNYVSELSAKAKRYKKPRSELMNSLRYIIRIIGFIIVPIAAAYILKPYLSIDVTPDFKSTLKGTSAIIVGMIPSGMFLLTSVALAVGIIKLARHNTLVQDLYSREMLARVDTICFDKRGTITDGRMTVRNVFNLKEDDHDIKDVISSMLFTLKDNNQTAIALCNKFGQDKIYQSITNLPFNSQRKLSAVTFEDIGTYAFGAPEFILSEKKYNQIRTKIEAFAYEGLRVLLFAKSPTPIENERIAKDFEAISLILLEDNIRQDAIETIKWFKDNEVAIKVISGDNPITVSEVSKRVGIENADKFISLEGLSDIEVYELADKYTVFGRVSPDQKAILIRSLNEHGHTTAMTGDGVNDILALKEADCAISVASGSEAARNVSHLVLMDNNFNSLPEVVYEGRRVINNIQSSASLYLMKTIFTLLFSVIILFIPFIHTYPFVTSHLMIMELFVIGMPSFFLSLQPNNERVKGRFIEQVIKKTLPCSLIMIINELLILLCQGTIGKITGYDAGIYTTLGAYAITLASVFSLYSICKPLNQYRAILFFSSLVFIILFFTLGFMGHLSNMSIASMKPFSDYWHHYLILLCIAFFDIPLLSGVRKLLANINFTKQDK
ncbi:MAG: HAD-IC family P-type ATPase [Clostridia bacterium]|nr:HAD-IC family P-type ATPase [Clostridia bacterium]